MVQDGQASVLASKTGNDIYIDNKLYIYMDVCDDFSNFFIGTKFSDLVQPKAIATQSDFLLQNLLNNIDKNIRNTFLGFLNILYYQFFWAIFKYTRLFKFF